MPPIHLLIKPSSLECNMRCSYCFSFDIADNRSNASYGFMKSDTLEIIIKNALIEAEYQCTFAFQGGEPTMVGLSFYESVIEYANRYNTKRIKVNYAIQTNGYEIDREWAAFFAKHEFLVGLSLDGNKQIHDLYRSDRAGKGTYSKVMQTVQLFNHYGVSYNILTVITAQTAKKIGQIYGFFTRNNFLYQQYIPCHDPLDEKRGRHSYSLTPDLYEDFLCTLFDLWYNDFIRGKKISIRYFDNLIQMMMGYPPESCTMMGYCTRQIVVEADGSVYPCDFYVLDEYRLGNLKSDSFSQIEETRDRIRFIEPSLQRAHECRECKWHSLCRGGCRRDCEPYGKEQVLHNYYCSAYKKFFEYSIERMRKIVYDLKKNAFPTSPFLR